MPKRPCALLLAILAIIPARFASAEAESRVVLRFGSLAPRGSSWERMFTQVFDEIEKQSGGALRSRLYFSGVMGDEPEMVAKVRRGELEGVLVSTLGLQAMVPETGVLEIPFLFDSLREVDRIRPMLHRWFRPRFEEEGFVLLSFIDQAGFIQLYSKERISSVADLARQKAWVWEGNAVHEEAYKALGINPIPLPVPAVLGELKADAINVVSTTPLTCLALGWIHHLKYVLKMDYRYAPAAVVIGREAFERLIPGRRGLLESVFQKFEPDIIRTMRQDNEVALAGMKKKGLEIVVPTDTELNEFKTKARPVAERLIRKGLFPESLYQQILDLKRQGT